MKKSYDLQNLLFSIDGKGYGSYKRIKESYAFEKYTLHIDHVQADPYAPPSKLRVRIDRKTTDIPDKLLDSKDKRIAVSDFLTRSFEKQINQTKINFKGKGRTISIDGCGQEILNRTSVLIGKDAVEVRFQVGLPAAGRRILGKVANEIFQKSLPRIVEYSLFYDNLDQEALRKQVILMLDQEFIRKELSKKNLVSFVANGSILPRESGVSERPLRHGLPFQSPKNLEISLNLPSGKQITGMGIKKGITLIVGGGYHGKSTLLKAIELGVYNHIPEDGREMVITCPDAMKIRAEDGRNIAKVNISPFINNLPGNKDTTEFSTENASGSTSQAANVIETLEMGTSLLLIDEDTSATNFMIRDGRMQQLVAQEKEPITPFIDKVRQMYDELGTSTILIIGGSGDYFDVADRVIMMDEYIPKDVTSKAKEIVEAKGDTREIADYNNFGKITPRIPLKSSFPSLGKKDRLKSKGKHEILYDRDPINISYLEQLVDESQTSCIAVMIDYLKKNLLDDRRTISELVDELYNHIEKNGLDAISPYTGHPGNLALPRKQEFCATLNRYRGIKVWIK